MIPNVIIRTRLFLIAFAIVQVLGLASMAASQSPPSDAHKYHLVTVTAAPATPAGAALLDSLKTHPTMARIAASCKVFDFQPHEELYQSRYAAALPPLQLPIVALVRSDGGVIFKASGPNIPQGDALATLLLKFGRADRKANPRPVPATPTPANQYTPYCPDGNCPTAPQRPLLPFDGSRLPNVIPDTVEVNPTVNADFNVPQEAFYIGGGIALLFLGVVVVLGVVFAAIFMFKD